jgi:DNA-binding transcriptional MerR regulator
MNPGNFAIGALARATGTKVETIRYYERIGLLPAPTRTTGNYRIYGPAHLTQLSFIRRARDLGFAINEVRQLLRLSDCPNQPCDAIDRIARVQLDAVERKIADLEALGAELRQMISHCRHSTVAECRIVEASEQHSLNTTAMGLASNTDGNGACIGLTI